jgi:predicted negative regulator of RcsB-dependent stress response
VETEEQELEALKEWWQEYGRTIVVGVVIGLGGVFGWTSWQNHQQSQAEKASMFYQRLIDDAARDRHQAVGKQAASLADEFSNSGYAVLAALLAAKSAYAENDLEGAKRQLVWMISQSAESSFKDIARIRLARLLIQENNLDEALSTLNGIDDDAFSATANEIRGDIRYLEGDMVGARTAYQKALTGDTIPGAMRSRVQMKVDDLGITDAGSLAG